VAVGLQPALGELELYGVVFQQKDAQSDSCSCWRLSRPARGAGFPEPGGRFPEKSPHIRLIGGLGAFLKLPRGVGERVESEQAGRARHPVRKARDHVVAAGVERAVHRFQVVMASFEELRLQGGDGRILIVRLHAGPFESRRDGRGAAGTGGARTQLLTARFAAVL
jgi:hypothetical protein